MHHTTRRMIGLVAVTAALLGSALLLFLTPSPTSALDLEQGQTGAQDGASPMKLNDKEVLVGAYVENIQTINPESNSFLADIYVWFRWSNPELRPDKTVELLNLYEAWQMMKLSDTGEPEKQSDGTYYHSARYTGAFNSALSLIKFPFGTQYLEFILEDFEDETADLQFVPDRASTSINPEITLPGYDIGTPTIAVSDNTYDSDFGQLDGTNSEIYSQATVSVPVSNPGLPNVIKYLVPIVLIVAAASLVFYIPPEAVEGRIVLGITALLTLVAMQWSSTESLPTVSYLTMLDVLYMLGVLAILASLVLGIRTSWMARDTGSVEAIASDERMMPVFLGVFGLAFTGVLLWYLVL